MRPSLRRPAWMAAILLTLFLGGCCVLPWHGGHGPRHGSWSGGR